MIQDLAGGVSEPAVERSPSGLNGQLRLSRVNRNARTCGSEAEELQPDEVKRLLEVLGFYYRYCRQSGLDRQRSTVPLSRY